MIRPNSFLLVILVAVTSVSATTYYVATNGSDSNVGTKTAPFLSIKCGIAAAGSPGDTLYLRGGQYNMGTGATGADQVLVQASGTTGSPITVSGFPGEKAVVRWSAANVYARFVFTAPGGGTQPVSYRIFQNFDVWGMFWMNSANEPIFRNLLIHHGAIGIFGSMWKGKVDRCVIHSSNGHGMYVSGTYNTITNSLFYNNGMLLQTGYPGTTSNNDGYGIQGAGYPFDGKHAGPQYQTWQNNLIANNTFAYNKKAGCTNWQVNATNNTFENNIFYQNGVGSPGGSTGIDWVSSGGGNIVKNNCFTPLPRARQLTFPAAQPEQPIRSPDQSTPTRCSLTHPQQFLFRRTSTSFQTALQKMQAFLSPKSPQILPETFVLKGRGMTLARMSTRQHLVSE